MGFLKGLKMESLSISPIAIVPFEKWSLSDFCESSHKGLVLDIESI